MEFSENTNQLRATEKVTPASKEDLTSPKEGWVKYTAVDRLAEHDFFVYYSHDKDGKSVPSAAIWMEYQYITYISGISVEQKLDPGTIAIVEKKLQEFPDGRSYKKRVHDMETLTGIEAKTRKGLALSRPELCFLYEVDSPIEGIEYDQDPRIEELRSQREPYQDMPTVFSCQRNQIATNPREIRPNTKAYVGPLQEGIFDLLVKYNIEQVYTKFPEGKIRQKVVEIGGKSTNQLKADLKQAGVNIDRSAEDMLGSKDFTTLPIPVLLNTVRLTAQDLGFNRGTPTIDQIYKKADELGLYLCPAEVGPHLRLQDKDQPLNKNWYSIAMQQIADSRDKPGVFDLRRSKGAFCLGFAWANPEDSWNLDHGLVFSLRKFETNNSQSLGLFNRLFKR